jgi:hypothetical protein
VRRPLIVSVLGLSLAGLMALPAVPAAAYVGPEISIAPGKTILLKKDPIPGMSVQFRSGNAPGLVPTAKPADCEADVVGCEVMPLYLDVPEEDPDALEAAGYILNITMTWDPGQSVENVPEEGTVRQNDLRGFLFQQPQIRNSNGTESFTSETHGNSPGTMIAVSPTSRDFKLVVANYHGVNNGYELEISLASAEDLEFDPSEYGSGNKPPPDYVQPTFNPPSASPRDNGFGGGDPGLRPSPSTPTTPTVDGAGPIVVPNIPGGKADARLVASSNLIVQTGLGRSGAQNAESKVVAQVVEKSSSTSVWLTLLALPVLAAIIALVLLARRRKQDPVAAPLPA